MLRRLHLLGLRTIGQLAALPDGALAEQFGPEGEAITRLTRGEGERPVVARETPAMLEEELEIDPPASRIDHLEAAATRLVERLAARLRSEYAACRELSLWLDLSDGSTFHQVTTLHEPTDQTGTLMRAVKRLMERMTAPCGRARPVMLSAAKHLPGAVRRACLATGDPSLDAQDDNSGQSALPPALHPPDGEDLAVSRIHIALRGLGGHHGEQLGMFRSRAADLKRARRMVRDVEEQLGGGAIYPLAGIPEERAAGHPLRVMADEAGLPRALLLEGRWERVREVSNRWRVVEGWWRRELSREYYRVITERDRLCLIFRDLSPFRAGIGRGALPRRSADTSDMAGHRALPYEPGEGNTWFLERIYA
jgi:hypothetical protein